MQMKSSHIWRSDIPDENISLSGRGVFVDVQVICQRVVAVPRARADGEAYQFSVTHEFFGNDKALAEGVATVGDWAKTVSLLQYSKV